jgi:sugar phosphate isomerase/epimerase
MNHKDEDTVLLGAVCFQEFSHGYLEFLDLAHSLALSWVEFKYEAPIKTQESSMQYTRIRRRAEELGIGLSMHSAFMGLNIASLDSVERKKSLEVVQESLTAASEMGITRVTLHGGHLSSAEYSKQNWERSQKYNIDSISTLLKFAETLSLSLCLENGNAFGKAALKHGLYPENMKQISESVEGTLYFTVDFGHGTYLSRDPSFLVSELGREKVLLSHLHSNTGLEDSHSPLGTGVLNLDQILTRSIKEKWLCPLSIEMKNVPDLQNSVYVVRKRIKALMENFHGNN